MGRDHRIDEAALQMLCTHRTTWRSIGTSSAMAIQTGPVIEKASVRQLPHELFFCDGSLRGVTT